MILPWVAVVLTTFSIAQAQAGSTTESQGQQTTGTFDLDTIARRTGSGFDLNAEIGITPLSVGDLGGNEFSRRMIMRADVGYLLVSEPQYWGFGATLGLGPRHTFQIGPSVSLVHLWTGFWGSTAFLVNPYGGLAGSFSAGWSVIGAEFQVSREDPVFFLKIRIPIGVPLFALKHDRAMAAQAKQ